MPYTMPSTLDEALDRVGSIPHPLIVAGCTDAYPAAGSAGLPDGVLDLSRLTELRGIETFRDSVRIGALTSWASIRDQSLPPAFDALRDAARQIGGVHIQNAATIGGNLCNASPAADGVPPLLILDAEVELASPRGARRVPLSDFFTGPRGTVRAADEILTAIHVPAQPDKAASAFEKLGSRTHLVISIAMVAALVRCGPDGRIAEARVAVGSCGPKAARLPDLEAALISQSPDAPDIPEDAFAPLAPIDDVRASAAYRRDVVPELCRRAIGRAGAARG